MQTERLAFAISAWNIFLVSVSFATTRYVNVSNTVPAAPYTNWSMAATAIQTAVDAASSGDEILVAPGVYLLVSQVFIPGGKTLILRGTQGREAVIDAQKQCIAVQVLGEGSLVEGFTIRNGTSPGYAGGVYTMANCTIRNCLIVSNSVPAGGAGVFMYGAAVVEDCTIQSNSASYDGGGIMIYVGTTGLVRNCTISDNSASYFGGGVYIQYGGMISNCWISGNHTVEAGGEGGGIYLSAEAETNPAYVVNSVICGNQAGQSGGGIFSYGPAGALYSVINCTVVSNNAGVDGGGAYARTTRFINDIIYFNSAPTNANLNAFDSIHSCIISNCCTTSNYFWPNITNAPAFVDAGAGDYRLATASFCIDAGTTNGAPGCDIDGNPRPRRGMPGVGAKNCDMGAYEYGFHFNAIQSVSSNTMRFEWDIQDLGRYHLDISTNAAGNSENPVWNSITVYTNASVIGAGNFLEYALAVTNPVPPMPGSAMFRLRVDRSTLGK